MKQIDENKKHVRKQKEEERNQKILEITQEFEEKKILYRNQINPLVKAIIEQKPGLPEQIIARIKEKHEKIGYRRHLNKTVEDFRKEPALVELVIKEIMKDFPEVFMEINQDFYNKREGFQQRVLEIDKYADLKALHLVE